MYAFALCFAACSSTHEERAAGCPTTVTYSAVHINNGKGNLGGALTLPAGCGPVPALLVVAGSGATDRDGNNLAAGLRTDTYLKIANGVAQSGIACLRFDKAGVGESLGAGVRPADQRIESEVADVALWIDWLRADPRFSAVVVAGHSLGALLGMLAAERKPLDGYISLEGAGRPLDEVDHEQLERNAGLSDDLLKTADAIFDELRAGRTVANVPPELAPLFRPEAQPYLISWLRYDPAAEFAKTTMPALVVQGTADIQITLTDAELLMKARPDARELIVDDMSHMLKEATLEQDSQARSYTDPSLPVRSEVIDAIQSFVNDVSPAQP